MRLFGHRFRFRPWFGDHGRRRKFCALDLVHGISHNGLLGYMLLEYGLLGQGMFRYRSFRALLIHWALLNRRGLRIFPHN